MDPPNPMYDELREAAGKLAVSLAPKKACQEKIKWLLLGAPVVGLDFLEAGGDLELRGIYRAC